MQDWIAEAINRTEFLSRYFKKGRSLKSGVKGVFEGHGGFKQFLKSDLLSLKNQEYDIFPKEWPGTKAAEELYNQVILLDESTGEAIRGDRVSPDSDSPELVFYGNPTLASRCHQSKPIHLTYLTQGLQRLV